MNRPFVRSGRLAIVTTIAGLLFTTLTATASCGGEIASSPGGARQRRWAAGTVLVLNDQPILAEEVDAIGADFALLEPQDSILQLRRLAVSRVLIPLIAARGLEADRRRRAEAMAQEYREAAIRGDLPAGPMTGPMRIERSGSFASLGFALWRTALGTEPGTWSEVFETPGCFHLLHVESREEGALPGLTRFTIGVFDFPYLDLDTATADIDAALDRSHLTILDESWRDAIPATWRYRLHAENP